MNKKLLVVFIMTILSTAIFISGCATNMQVAPQTRQAIHSINIDNNIPKPKEIYYMSSLGIASMGFGVIGALTVGETHDVKQKDELMNIIKANNIDIGQIVSQQFTRQLQQNGINVVNGGNSDATLHINIDNYGLSARSQFSGSMLGPILIFDVELDKDGVVVWKTKNITTTITSDMPRHNLAEIEQNPQVLVQMWDAAAAKMVANALVRYNH